LRSGHNLAVSRFAMFVFPGMEYAPQEPPCCHLSLQPTGLVSLLGLGSRRVPRLNPSINHSNLTLLGTTSQNLLFVRITHILYLKDSVCTRRFILATDQELDEIRRRVDLVDLISHYVTLKKAGANFKALCPFHEERTGSFMVSPEKQIFKCFGCNESGNIFGFVMKMEGLNFPEAVKFLADRCGVVLIDNFKKNEIKKEDKNRLLLINELSCKYFEAILNKHHAGASAKEYLKKRGIGEEMIKKFRIGFVPSQRGLNDFLKKRGFSEEEIVKAGKPDRFFNRIMFPICDAMGNVIAFTGREFPESRGPKYLNTAETSLFYKSRALYGINHARGDIRLKGTVVFVEGQMDVIASHQSGVKHCVASSGTAITEDHLKIMYRYGQKFILAFDNDEAGKKATEKAIEICLKENYNTDVVVMPDDFKDAGEVIEKEPKLWSKLIGKAIPAVQWHFEQVFGQYGENDLNGTQKKQIASKLLPIIKMLTDDIERQHYIQKLAKRLSISEEILNKTIANKGTMVEPAIEENQPTKLDCEGQVIAEILNHPALAKDLIEEIEEKYFDKKYITIVNKIKIWYNRNIHISENVQKELLAYLRKNLQASEQQELENIITSSLNPKNELDASEDGIVLESALQQGLEHLRQNYHEKEKINFARLISEAEESGDRKRVKELLGELQIYLQNSGGIKNGKKNN
jgi:DNA primase